MFGLVNSCSGTVLLSFTEEIRTRLGVSVAETANAKGLKFRVINITKANSSAAL